MRSARTRTIHRKTRRTAALVLAFGVVAGACGGGDGDGGSTEGTIVGDTIVVDEDALEEARRDLEDEEAPVALTVDDTDVDDLNETSDGVAETDGAAEDEIEVAEAEDDPIDGLLNSLNVFNNCLADQGFELDGFPGDDSGRPPEDFEQDYIQALIACAAESGIQEAGAAFGEAQANLTPEEIEQTNFGLPVFKECLEDLGWEVGELVPDDRGALGFGDGVDFGLTPPGGGGIADFNTDDIAACRLEAEQYTAENFEPSSASDDG